MALSTLSMPQIPLDTPLKAGQYVRVAFPNTSISKDGVIQRVIHSKRPANTKDGVYEILKIDEKFQTYWLRTLDGETITTAKRGYIQDFASEAIAA